MPPSATNSRESTMPEVTLVEAINLALARAMEDDPDVVVLGEDVGVNGGVFRATVGPAAALWTGARARYAAVRTSDQRALRRHGGAGTEAGRRDPVHGIYLSLHRSTGEPCLATAQPDPGTAHLSDGSAHPAWRRHSRARASFREHRGDARPYSRFARGHALVAGTRLWTSARRDPRSRSGGVSGADAHLPRGQRRGGRQRRSLAAGSSPLSCEKVATSR